MERNLLLAFLNAVSPSKSRQNPLIHLYVRRLEATGINDVWTLLKTDPDRLRTMKGIGESFVNKLKAYKEAKGI